MKPPFAWSSHAKPLAGLPSVELDGLLAIPGAQTDRSGLEGELEAGSPTNALGGFSAIDYSSESDGYYVLDDESTGGSDVLEIDKTRFLVLESDSENGIDAKAKRGYLADIAEASDISHLDSIAQGLPTWLKADSLRDAGRFDEPSLQFEWGKDSGKTSGAGVGALDARRTKAARCLF